MSRVFTLLSRLSTRVGIDYTRVGLWLGAGLIIATLTACSSDSDSEVTQPVVELPASNVVIQVDNQTAEPAPETPNAPAVQNFSVPDNIDLADVTDLILITGQSNALGALTQFDAGLDSPHSRVLAFTNEGWRVADLHQFWDMTHPGNFALSDPERDPYNNFGLHFGKIIASNRDDRTVAFVLVTAPGQEIAHWDLGGGFFAQIRNKALNALNQIPHKSQFDGILWHQGESDAADSDYYTDKLNSLISNFRNESWFGTEPVFICGETVGMPVNNRLMALNFDGDDNTACVEGAGLPSLGDGIHFAAEGLRIIGERYAWQYITMRPRPPSR